AQAAKRPVMPRPVAVERSLPSAGTRSAGPPGGGEKEMRVPLRVATIVTACALLLGAIFAGNIATASPNQFLDKANGHPTFENGKSIAHPSSGTEVSFDDERALGADIQSGASSDAPPDATASAL